METKQKIGVVLIVLPIVITLIIAIINGFSFAHCWLGSCGTDVFWGVIGLIAIIVGLVLYGMAKGEETE